MTSGPATSPTLPPTPWKDSITPLRLAKWWDSEAAAGRCQSEWETETTATPSNNSGYTGEIPISREPNPDAPTQTASNHPHHRRTMPTNTPPGSVIRPEVSSRTACIPPTPTPFSPNVC